MKVLGWSSCLLLALSATSGTAQTVPAGTAPVQPAKSDADKKVCRRDASTGSILPKSVCHTKAQWAEIDAANHQGADQALSRRGSTFNAQP